MENSPGRPPRPTPAPAAGRARRRRAAAPVAEAAAPRTATAPVGHGPERPPGAEPDGAGDPPARPSRRRSLLLALGVAATASAAALVAGLLSWTPSEPADPARPLTAAEAERLAAMRVTAYRDVRSGVHVTVGAGAARTELVGWVDWARPLVYLDVGGPAAGAERGLVQATPTALVARPDPSAAATPAPPPLVPPTDRWQLREPPPGRGLTAVLDLLLALSADRPDPVAAEARWLGRESTAGTPVDLLEAPLAAGPTAVAPATPAPVRQVRLWLDRDARLHRLAGRLPDDTPVTVELERSDRPTLRPVDALGGRPGLPRALTDAEADRLTRLPSRLRAAGGAALTGTAPLGPTANLRAAGWLNWAGSSAYLAVGEVGTPGRRTLLRHRAGQATRVEVPTEGGTAELPARPPLPAPAGVSWSPPAPPTDDLDRLVGAALRAGGPPADARSAVRLRGDRLADRTVDVIELRDRRAPLRYWIDRDGLLRRVELRTGRGVWAQLELTPGPVPALPTAMPRPTDRSKPR
ncbi:hypothetical protein [Micromonospora inositola]|uniref:Uncharacterized protein n=1 Tax=Micromonospora inositola TaxID=47865 RepID=A0A1C5J102_9ACTN|nr:hypothetical protein [Micromonospora inositola]SCG63971.1 hypothetical protein GA0070613_3773 [Micromonospora inositola]